MNQPALLATSRHCACEIILAEIEDFVSQHRQKHQPGNSFIIPWSVLLARLGLGVTVNNLLDQAPRPCPDRLQCLVDAAGRIFEHKDGDLVQCPRERAGHCGRVYCPFPGVPETFKLWVFNQVFLTFVAPLEQGLSGKPQNWKIEPLDHDHENTRMDNILIKVEHNNDLRHHQAAEMPNGVLM